MIYGECVSSGSFHVYRGEAASSPFGGERLWSLLGREVAALAGAFLAPALRPPSRQGLAPHYLYLSRTPQPLPCTHHNHFLILLTIFHSYFLVYARFHIFSFMIKSNSTNFFTVRFLRCYIFYSNRALLTRFDFGTKISVLLEFTRFYFLLLNRKQEKTWLFEENIIIIGIPSFSDDLYSIMEAYYTCACG